MAMNRILYNGEGLHHLLQPTYFLLFSEGPPRFVFSGSGSRGRDPHKLNSVEFKDYKQQTKSTRKCPLIGGSELKTALQQRRKSYGLG